GLGIHGEVLKRANRVAAAKQLSHDDIIKRLRRRPGKAKRARVEVEYRPGENDRACVEFAAVQVDRAVVIDGEGVGDGNESANVDVERPIAGPGQRSAANSEASVVVPGGACAADHYHAVIDAADKSSGILHHCARQDVHDGAAGRVDEEGSGVEP